MATLEIDIDPEVVSQRWRQDLGGNSYILKVVWNEREQVWNLELSDTNEGLIASCPLVLGTTLFSDYSWEDGIPSGIFALVNLADDSGPSFGRYDLGNTVKLFYVEAE